MVDLIVSLGIYAVVLMYYRVVPSWTVIFVPPSDCADFHRHDELRLDAIGPHRVLSRFPAHRPVPDADLIVLDICNLSREHDPTTFVPLDTCHSTRCSASSWRFARRSSGSTGTSLVWRSPRHPRWGSSCSAFSTFAGQSVSSLTLRETKSVRPAVPVAPRLHLEFGTRRPTMSRPIITADNLGKHYHLGILRRKSLRVRHGLHLS